MSTINNIKAQNNPIKHYRGDVFDEVWSITKNDGTAYDLSGKAVVLTIRKQKNFNSAVETLSTAAGDITLSGASNNILTFNKVITLDLNIYHYDMEVTTDNLTITFGTWNETRDVT